MYQPLTGALILVTLAETVAVMWLWHHWTRGVWRSHMSGKAVMGLLAMIALILTLASISIFYPDFFLRAELYVVAYLGLIAAMFRLGKTIHDHQMKDLKKKGRDSNG